MLAKRIIPCLDIKDGRTVKGINFLDLRDAGDPVENAVRYCDEGADELVFLDITATVERREPLSALVRRIAEHINIPFTVGGGIRTVDDVRSILMSGADKVSINSQAVRNKGLVAESSSAFGSQCMVVAVDVRANASKASGYEVYIDGGRTPTGLDALEWALEVQNLGCGEILLTSMEADGTKAGYDIGITSLLSSRLSIPVIASGGAGRMEDFSAVFAPECGADAALAASVFHYHEIAIPALKAYLQECGIVVRV